MSRGAEKGMDRSGVEELGARLIQPEDVGEVVWDVVTKPERYHVKLAADRKTNFLTTPIHLDKSLILIYLRCYVRDVCLVDMVFTGSGSW